MAMNDHSVIFNFSYKVPSAEVGTPTYIMDVVVDG